MENIYVTNNLDKDLYYEYNFVGYKFPVGKTVELSIAAARHMLGYGDEDKEKYLVQLGLIRLHSELEEATEKFKSLMPHRAINYTEIAKSMFPIQPMPQGAIPYYLDHMVKAKCKDCWYRDESGPDDAKVSRCDHPDHSSETRELTDLSTCPEWCPRNK